jgi:ASC-1-like (ASCH) protein
MNLEEPHFSNVLSGKKIYELRVNDDKRKKMNVGDIILMTHNDTKDNDTKEYFYVIITEKKFYDNFSDAITDSGIKKILPNVKTKGQGVKLYESFPGYIEGAEKNGVVRFKLEVLKDIGF